MNHLSTIVITADKTQVDMEEYIVMVVRITSKLSLIYAEISAFEQNSPIYI
jgi:hypothetical protein